MRRESRKLIWDALDAVDSIISFASGKTYRDYEGDLLFRSAVERQFGIVGEALVRLQRLDPETAQRVSDVREIIKFRNLVVHGYDSLDHRIVWGVIQDDLPHLREVLAQLLSQESATD